MLNIDMTKILITIIICATVAFISWIGNNTKKK